MGAFEDFLDEAGKEPLITKSKSEVKATFPCDQCGGTGKKTFGNGNCPTCKGKGHFKTSPQQRAKAREYAAKRKTKLILNAMQMNQETGIVEQIYDISSWNTFAASMYEQHKSGKAWSEKQVAAARSMLNKIEATRLVKERAKVAVDVDNIVAIFSTAVEKGYKTPKLRFEGVCLQKDKHSDTIYVKESSAFESTYYGKIVDGLFNPSAACNKEVVEILLGVNNNALEKAIAYGQKTGICACCGRQLTNHASIELGIGPICKEKWFG